MRHTDVPVITGIYDLLSGRRDGTITPQAPIIVSGTHLNRLRPGEVKLCLVPAIDYKRVIEIHLVYKCAHDRIIVGLPELAAGEYSPALILTKPEADIYIFPIVWVVTHESGDRRFYTETALK